MKPWILKKYFGTVYLILCSALVFSQEPLAESIHSDSIRLIRKEMKDLFLMSEKKRIGTIKIYNSERVVVLVWELIPNDTSRIPTSDLAAGAYYLEVLDDHKVIYRERFIRT